MIARKVLKLIFRIIKNQKNRFKLLSTIGGFYSILTIIAYSELISRSFEDDGYTDFSIIDFFIDYILVLPIAIGLFILFKIISISEISIDYVNNLKLIQSLDKSSKLDKDYYESSFNGMIYKVQHGNNTRLTEKNQDGVMTLRKGVVVTILAKRGMSKKYISEFNYGDLRKKNIYLNELQVGNDYYLFAINRLIADVKYTSEKRINNILEGLTQFLADNDLEGGFS